MKRKGENTMSNVIGEFTVRVLRVDDTHGRLELQAASPDKRLLASATLPDAVLQTMPPHMSLFRDLVNYAERTLAMVNEAAYLVQLVIDGRAVKTPRFVSESTLPVTLAEYTTTAWRERNFDRLCEAVARLEPDEMHTAGPIRMTPGWTDDVLEATLYVTLLR